MESPPESPRHHSSSWVRLTRRGTFFQRHERVGVVSHPVPLDQTPGVVPSSGGVVGQAPGADDAPGVRPHTDSPASTAPIPTGHVPYIGATVSDAGSSMSTIHDMHDSVDDELQVRR